MKKFKKVISLLLVVACLLQVCNNSYLALAENNTQQKINTTSLDGIKENNDTNWEYVLISGGTEIQMVYGKYSNQYPGMIIPSDKYVQPNDKYARFLAGGASHPAYSGDTAAVYKVQEAGKLDLTLKVSVESSYSNGVQVKIYKNTNENILHEATVVAGAAGTKTFTVKGTSVQEGDRIYFALNMNGALTSDGGTFEAVVKTAQEEEQTIDTTSLDGIKENNDTNWEYVLISGGTEIQMVYGKYSNQYPGMIIPSDKYVQPNDKYARFLAGGASHPAYSGDIAAVYTVDQEGYLDCSLQVRFKNTSDGVNVKIWINSKAEYLLIPTQVSDATGAELLNYEIPGVSVRAGDKIYFALDYNTQFNSDDGHFVASVKTGKKLAVNTSYSGNIMASQADYGYSYVYISDEGQETAMTYDESSSSYMNGYSGKAYEAEDDATAFFNDRYQAGAATSGYTAQIYTVPVDGKITLQLSAKPNNATSYDGDGFGIAIALNDCAIGGLEDWTYITKAGKEKSIQKDINAKAGDKIYFLYTKNGGAEGSYKPSFDTAILKATVMYTEKVSIAEQDRTTGNVELIASANPNNVKVGSVHKSSESFGPTPKYNFSYQTVSVPDNVIGDMVYESTTNSYRKTLDKNQVDYWGFFSKNSAGTASVGDTLTVYTMPCKAKISVEVRAKVMKEKSDGVAVSISRNSLTNVLHEPQVIEYAKDAEMTTIKKELVANAGDKINIRLNKNGVNSHDTVQFDVIVTYLELNPEGDATEGVTVHPLVGTTTDFKTALTNKETGVWSYQKIKLADNTISDMSYEYTEASNSHSYRCSLDAADLNYWGYVNSTGVMGSAVDYDVLVVYTAPEKVKIDVTWNVQVAREKSDGAVFSIFRNNPQNVIGKRNVLQYEDGKQALEYNGIVLNKGDKLYFRLNKKGSSSYDSIATNIFIKCIEVNPIENATEGNTKLVIEQGTEIRFNQDANTTWGGNGFYYYASGIGTEDFYKLVYNTKLECYTFPANTINDEWVRIGTSGNVRTGNKYDSIIVYQVQNNAKITVKVKCKSLATNGDGVRVKLFRNEQKIAPTDARWCVVQGDNQFEYTKQINVAKGEYIMLRVNRNALNSYDNLDVQFSIIYDEIYEKAPIGSVQGVKLPSCLPCEKELETASVLNHPSHVNRVPFEGEVSGLTGRAKNSVSVSAEIPKDYLEESSGKKLLWVYVTSGICLLVLIGGTVCGVYFKKRKTKEIITEQE